MKAPSPPQNRVNSGAKLASGGEGWGEGDCRIMFEVVPLTLTLSPNC
jgi:hypothetical protein